MPCPPPHEFKVGGEGSFKAWLYSRASERVHTECLERLGNRFWNQTGGWGGFKGDT